MMRTSRTRKSPLAPLGREEYVEQAHFFRALAERLRENVPMQEVLGSVREEVLATTKLPMAIDFLLAELRHAGVLGPAMARLRTLLHAVPGVRDSGVGRRAAAVRFADRARSAAPRGRVSGRGADAAGALSLSVRSAQPQSARLRPRPGGGRPRSGFDATWRDWIRTVRRQIGMVDLADLIYVHSEYY